MTSPITLNESNRRVSRSGLIKGFVYVTAFIIAVVFLYTAFSKLRDMSSFFDTIERMYIPKPLNMVIAYAIPISEIVVVLALMLPKYRSYGLLASAILLLIFTGYLSFLKLTKSDLPCSCGGIVGELSWTNHIILNIVLLISSFLAFLWTRPTRH